MLRRAGLYPTRSDAGAPDVMTVGKFLRRPLAHVHHLERIQVLAGDYFLLAQNAQAALFLHFVGETRSHNIRVVVNTRLKHAVCAIEDHWWSCLWEEQAARRHDFCEPVGLWLDLAEGPLLEYARLLTSQRVIMRCFNGNDKFSLRLSVKLLLPPFLLYLGGFFRNVGSEII